MNKNDVKLITPWEPTQNMINLKTSRFRSQEGVISPGMLSSREQVLNFDYNHSLLPEKETNIFNRAPSRVYVCKGSFGQVTKLSNDELGVGELHTD